MKATEQALKTLKAERSQKSLLDRMQTRRELYDLLGYQVDASPDTEPARG